ncbi:hypothetical protein [Vibrio sp. 10N.222.55.B11]|uniref:hypothetical protein n=1 Tax=Vibrio sp. 10N.222.55.B11 TaxID=3229648 RepID=UPI00354ADEF5
MILQVKLSPTAMASFDNLPQDQKKRARRAVDLLEAGLEKQLRPHRLRPNQKLNSGRVSTKIRIIYKRVGDVIEVVDFVNHDLLLHIAKTSRGA